MGSEGKSFLAVEVDVGARIARGGVVGGVHQGQVGAAVVVEVAAEGADRSPGGKVPAAFGGKAPRAAAVDGDCYLFGLVAGAGIYQYHVGPAGSRRTRQEDAAAVVAGEPHRALEGSVARAGVDQGGEGEGVGGVALAQDDIVAAVAIQVAESHVAGAVGLEGGSVRLAEPLGAAPVDPRTLLACGRLPAGEDQIVFAVAVHIARRRRQRP